VSAEALLCRRCQCPLERGDIRCAVCAAATDRASDSAEEIHVEILRCTGCAAAMAYNPAEQAPKCSFCQEVLRVETLIDPPEQTEGFFPFTNTADEARKGLRRWLGSLGWFRPSDLKSSARMESLKPLWFVGWVFDAHAVVSWAADSNANSHRAAWAPHAGQTEMEFDDILVSASRGLGDEEVTAMASSYREGSVEPEARGAEGATIERFDVQRSQARAIVLKAASGVARKRVMSGEIPGSRFRKVSVSLLLKGLETRRYSFPAWVLAYRYRNRLYRAVISGQNTAYVHGRAPVSLAKILLLVVAVLMLIFVVIAVIAASVS